MEINWKDGTTTKSVNGQVVTQKISTYKVFVNGKLFNTTNIYDYAMNRALGIAMFLNLDFVNVKSKSIIDKWIGEKGMIIITKN